MTSIEKLLNLDIHIAPVPDYNNNPEERYAPVHQALVGLSKEFEDEIQKLFRENGGREYSHYTVYPYAFFQRGLSLEQERRRVIAQDHAILSLLNNEVFLESYCPSFIKKKTTS